MTNSHPPLHNPAFACKSWNQNERKLQQEISTSIRLFNSSSGATVQKYTDDSWQSPIVTGPLGHRLTQEMFDYSSNYVLT